jgi:flagellin-specific chaperone FliS
MFQNSSRTSISERAQKSQSTISRDKFSASQSSQLKEKIRETRKKTANEKISRMNRIIKTTLQKMLNVTMIANLAVVVAAISQTILQISLQSQLHRKIIVSKSDEILKILSFLILISMKNSRSSMSNNSRKQKYSLSKRSRLH